MNIKDYLHLYLNAPFLITSVNPYVSRWKDHEGCSIILSEYNLKDVLIGNIEGKPYLRPISDMTVQEASDLEWEMWDHIPDFCFGDREMIVEMFVNSRTENRPGFTVFVKAINWLRRHRFDCDGLIDAGLAIDSTTLPKVIAI